MARIARVVVPGYPHHVIQRGCRRQQTFFNSDDYRYYLDLLRHGKTVPIWLSPDPGSGQTCKTRNYPAVSAYHGLCGVPTGIPDVTQVKGQSY